MIKNILLAEDDRGTALLVKKHLETKGYSVYTAGNGIEALKILAIERIDLVITDVIMPKMDGVDLYNALKKDSKTANIPIIIVTDKAVFKESFTNLGISNFVEKTSDVTKLLEKIVAIATYTEAAKKFPKILLSGLQGVVIEQMSVAMQGLRYVCATATSSEDILSKAITMIPHAIVIDVMFQDKISAAELIRALRCFNCLRQTKIITYAYFPEDLGMDVDAVKAVEEAMAECKEAGHDQYIGRFNQGFLVEKLAALGI